MKKILFFILFICSLSVSAQNTAWVSSEPYNSFVTWTNKIIHDKSGNTFISGNHGQYADSIFIVKYDNNGNKLWEKNYSGYGEIPGLCSDSSGNLYAALFVSGGNIIIDGQQYNRPYGADFFTLFIKYDTNGNILWLKQTKLAMLLSERTDQNDNLIVTGNIVATVYLDNNITLSTTSGYGTNYLAKFNTNGECIWAQENDGGWYPLICNPKGEMFAKGEVDTIITVGQGSHQVTLYPANGASYVAKYDSTGTLTWVKQTSISLIAPDEFGNAYTVEYDGNYPNTGFITKYDSTGNLLWKRTSVYLDQAYKCQMKCGTNGILYFTGGFSNYMTIDSNTYNDGGNTRAFVAKIDSSGTLKWVTISSGAGGAGAKDITIAKSNEIYITGDMGGGTSVFGSHSVNQSAGVFTAKIIDNEIQTTAVKDAPFITNTFTVFPNPGSDLLTVNFNTDNSQTTYEYTISNPLGQIVYSEVVKDVSGSFTKQVNISSLPKGSYYVTLYSNSTIPEKKIVKEVKKIVFQ